MTSPNNSRTKRSTLTKAELEATVSQLRAALGKAENAALEKEKSFADLKDALEDAHSKEKSLKIEIADLQTDLYHQKKSIQNLQKDLDKVSQLKAELEKVKTSAIQLAQTNEKLMQEIDTLKKENKELKAHETIKKQENNSLPPKQGRPIQKESEKRVDFATKSWLL